MVTFDRWHRWLRNLVGRPSAVEGDWVLDCWIREALLDEALAQPPALAWERLRRTIIARRIRIRGMWVLDECPRESPEMLSTRASYHDLPREVHLHTLSRESRLWEIREAVWGNMQPTFGALVNW